MWKELTAHGLRGKEDLDNFRADILYTTNHRQHDVSEWDVVIHSGGEKEEVLDTLDEHQVGDDVAMDSGGEVKVVEI